jgi:hypothetical protein
MLPAALLLLLLPTGNKLPLNSASALPALSMTYKDFRHTFVAYEQSFLGIHGHPLP